MATRHIEKSAFLQLVPADLDGHPSWISDVTARLDQAVTVSGWLRRFLSGQTVHRDRRPPLLRQPDSGMISDLLLPLQVVVPEGEALLAKHGCKGCALPAVEAIPVDII